MDEKDIGLELSDSMLTISGEKREEKEEKKVPDVPKKPKKKDSVGLRS